MVTRSARTLVRETLQRLEQRFPAIGDYTDEQRERTAEDLAHIVDFLAAALYVDDADLFTGFLLWTADVLTARGVPTHSILLALELLAEQLLDFPRARDQLDAGRTALAPHS
ncbi:cobalamin-binding protein [Streptomyces sp. PRh5]|nr:cobalamin-binding protein [Streptomyces sp. PRh5]